MVESISMQQIHSYSSAVEKIQQVLQYQQEINGRNFDISMKEEAYQKQNMVQDSKQIEEMIIKEEKKGYYNEKRKDKGNKGISISHLTEGLEDNKKESQSNKEVDAVKGLKVNILI